MTVFISSTTETREKKGEGAAAETNSPGYGVGIGILKKRIEDQRVVYVIRRGMKTSMVDTTKSQVADSLRRMRCLVVSKWAEPK